MKTVIERVGGGPVRFDGFADKYGLVMEVRERGISDDQRARAFGNGRTPEEAIDAYKPQLLGQRIKIGYPHFPSGQEGQYVTCPTEWLP